jgi:repressor LexA
MTSTASVFELIGRLVDAGYLSRLGGRIAPAGAFFSTPLFLAGAIDKPESDKSLNIANYVMPNQRQSLLIEVTTNQLASENILPGDILVVERGLRVEAGDIFVRQGPVGFEPVVVPADYREPTAEHPQGTAFSPPYGLGMPQFGQIGVAVSVVRSLRRREDWSAAPESTNPGKDGEGTGRVKAKR